MSHSDKINWRSVFNIRSIIFIVLGAICAVIAIKGFMIPNHLLDGGITGISILIHEIFHIEVTIPLVYFTVLTFQQVQNVVSPFLQMGHMKYPFIKIMNGQI